MTVRRIGIGTVDKRATKAVGFQSKDRQPTQAAEPLWPHVRREKHRVIWRYRHASGATIYEVRRIGDDVAARASTEEASLCTTTRATEFIFAHGSKNPCWARDDRSIHAAIVPRNA